MVRQESEFDSDRCPKFPRRVIGAFDSYESASDYLKKTGWMSLGDDSGYETWIIGEIAVAMIFSLELPEGSCVKSYP